MPLRRGFLLLISTLFVTSCGAQSGSSLQLPTTTHGSSAWSNFVRRLQPAALPQRLPFDASLAGTPASKHQVTSTSIFVPAAATWGVAGEGAFQAAGTPIFEFCNGIVNPQGGCPANLPPEYGVRSFTESDNGSSSTCDANSSAGADCASTVSVRPAFGTIEGALSLSVSGLSMDGNSYAAIASSSSEAYSLDYVTPTSKTLPNGTAVQFKATESLTGSFMAPCADIAPGQTLFVAAYSYGPSVRGDCVNGSFVFTTSAGGKGKTDTQKFTLYIGSAQMIQPSLQVFAQLIDCSGGGIQCPPGGPYHYLGPLSVTFGSMKAVYKLDPITPGVSYKTASGHSYL